MNILCQAPGCSSFSEVGKLCSAHYQRQRRTGGFDLKTRKRGTGALRHGYIVHGINKKRIPEHVLIAEKALGKPLPDGAQVHHIDGIRSNNSGKNLVICPDQTYHLLLHRRQRAMDACGNPNWMPCEICKIYDDPANMYSRPSRLNSASHRACRNKASLKRYYRRMATLGHR